MTQLLRGLPARTGMAYVLVQHLDPTRESALTTIVGQRMGVDFTSYKHATLRRRIQRRMLLHKFETLKPYADYLRSHKNEVRELYNDILIHVIGRSDA